MHASTRPARVGAAALAVAVLVGCSAPTGSPQASSVVSAVASPSPTAPTPTAVASVPPLTGVDLELVASGLVDPIGVTSAGDGSDRLFVNERGGVVRLIDANGSLQGASFVDLSDRVQAGGEQGLLGLAFHPDFAANGRVFVHYSRIGDGATVISELSASADRGTADPASERVVLTLSQPFANHNGGQIAFGPDGYLYIGLGDGGSGGDPYGNGQNRQTLLGKILRIDVDAPPAAGRAYAIPDDNPYAGGGISPGDGLPEIWAYGLRNPWRFSFDRDTGDLYIGDVGQNAWEEIDRQPASSHGGENYGWSIFEGAHCDAGCEVTTIGPIAEYSHSNGCSVTGGYVYRGTRQPALVGTYLFADYCSGVIFTLAEEGLTPRQLAESGLRVTSFGEAEDGEVYLVDLTGGGLYRVVAR
jgi:glucose/arabinose dehydrogenase